MAAVSQMTLAEIKAAVKSNVNRDDKDAEIARHIKRALLKIGGCRDWKQMRRASALSLAINQSESVMITWTILKIHGLRITSPSTRIGKIEIWTKDRLLEVFPDRTTNAGIPSCCYVDYTDGIFPGGGTYLPTIVYNIKSSEVLTLELSYSGWIEDLGDDSSVIVLPTYVEDAVIAYATSELYKSLQLYQDGMFWQNEYQRHLVDAAQRDEAFVEPQLVMAQYPELEALPLNYQQDPFAGQPRR